MKLGPKVTGAVTIAEMSIGLPIMAWLLTSHSMPFWMVSLVWLVCVSAGVTAVVLFGWFLVHRNFRATCAVHAVACMGLTILMIWAGTQHSAVRDRWFLKEGMFRYQQALNEVLARESAIPAERRELPAPSNYRGLVFGRSSSDGSVTIEFFDAEGTGRHGFLHHSGEPLKSHPYGHRYYLRHLTNGWYSF